MNQAEPQDSGHSALREKKSFYKDTELDKKLSIQREIYQFLAAESQQSQDQSKKPGKLRSQEEYFFDSYQQVAFKDEHLTQLLNQVYNVSESLLNLKQKVVEENNNQ